MQCLDELVQHLFASSNEVTLGRKEGGCAWIALMGRRREGGGFESYK
jgi:hypothetical protein